MEAKIINYIKEKQKEYKYGSDAYNVLRHLEVTLPQFLTQPNNTGELCNHHFVVISLYWQQCSHCGMMQPTGQTPPKTI